MTRFVSWSVAARPGASVREFCTWVLSSEGQLVVESVGFEPLMPRDRSNGLAKLSTERGERVLVGSSR